MRETIHFTSSFDAYHAVKWHTLQNTSYAIDYQQATSIRQTESKKTCKCPCNSLPI